ncbi:mersacidin/lichenicidin family type 2 lantibiotic [Archangium lansingense]|uniref:Mersacidin/lichenicidin family type 2 lantibiotic n=1 Tax=Archangium lansingense TaxID=2995310 RepID=A0ABT4A0Z2_9BACT|nr:mersacidin/lichenicidin family type 2 lantibiotic [Archangium lansinium]MCY1075305.1 mersacidin/lichenicidin family type 2 lantibiotic [Archangium lansinium]
MKTEMIVRAWKDPAFRASLSAEERAALPESPSGESLSDLDETELCKIIGGVLAVKQLKLEDFASTGCTPPLRLTCGIVNCTPPRDFEVL